MSGDPCCVCDNERFHVVEGFPAKYCDNCGHNVAHRQ